MSLFRISNYLTPTLIFTVLVINLARAEVYQSGFPLESYYTRNYSIATGSYSDHAPIVYENILTWNIGQQGLAERDTLTGRIRFYYHKFINIRPPEEEQIEADEQYQARLSRIASALSDIFTARSHVRFALLQELPHPHFAKSIPHQIFFQTELEKMV